MILELKFTNRFPRWMHDLVRTFELRRQSVPKYNTCVDAIGGRFNATCSQNLTNAAQRCFPR